MRRVLIGGCLLLFALLAKPVVAQEWAKKMFDATSFNFGVVAKGSSAQHVFTIKNIYKEDIHISSVRSSCGCTVPTLDVQTLKTYEKARLTAVFDTNKFDGERKATLTVTIDQPFYAEVQVNVEGYIRRDVVVEPGSINFGSVDQGSPATQKVNINYAGRSDWQITDVQSANPHLSAELAETSRSGGQASYALTVHLRDDVPAGYIRDQIYIVTNDSKSPQFPVEVQGQVVSEVSVSPSSLFLGVVKPGQKVTKRLIVRGKHPFRVLSVRSDDDTSFEFSVPDKTATLHLIPVTFVAGDKPGRVNHMIQIETDLGAGVVSDLAAYALVDGEKK